MRSPELALARDFLRRGMLIIPVVWLAMFGITLWIMMWFVRGQHEFVQARESVVLHVSLTLVMGFGAAVAVLQSHGRLSRFFARPISVTRLVACQMALGMVTIALMYATGASLLNLTGVQWPILGPSLFLATALACALAAIWTLEGTVIGQLIGCGATTAPLVIWFNRCYGARIMGDWHAMWRNPSAAEAATLGVISLAAFGVAVLGVQRTRRGELFNFDVLIDWWRRYRSSGAALIPFRSPMAAQQWSEWREKLGAAPAAGLAGVLGTVAIAWAGGLLPASEALGLGLAMPMLLLLAVIPMVYGLVGGSCEGKHPMKHVLATRPVTDSFIAAVILRNCFLALAGAWVTWLAGYGILAGLLFLAGHREEFDRFFPVDKVNPLIVCLGAPLISWTITGVMATLVATGRPRFWVTGLTSLFVLFIGFLLIKEFLLPDSYAWLTSAWLAVSGGLYAAATIACFVAALSGRLISLRSAARLVAIWLLIVAVLGWLSWPHIPDAYVAVHALGFLSLAILPFAGLPLAVRWNRHR